MADSEKILEIIRQMAQVIEEHKDELTQLDQPIGDSDHGINMPEAFRRWSRSFPAWKERTSGPF